MRWWGAAGVMLVCACDDAALPTSDQLNCTLTRDFAPGIEVPSIIGGSRRSQTIVQVAADLALIVGTAEIELTSTCRRLAEAQGVTDLATIDAESDPHQRVVAMCALVTPGPAPAPGVCTISPSDRSDCLLTCAGCEGVCETNARAKAVCTGADPSDRSELAALAARFDSLDEVMAGFSGAASQIFDIKAACVPVVAARMGTSIATTNLIQQTTKNVLGIPNDAGK